MAPAVVGIEETSLAVIAVKIPTSGQDFLILAEFCPTTASSFLIIVCLQTMLPPPPRATDLSEGKFLNRCTVVYSFF